MAEPSFFAELKQRKVVQAALIYGAVAFGLTENEHEDRDRTPLSSDAKDILGKDADFLDYYLSASFSAGNIPLFFRLGDQVVNWGDSNFVRNGIDVINPFDLAALNQPFHTQPTAPAAFTDPDFTRLAANNGTVNACDPHRVRQTHMG